MLDIVEKAVRDGLPEVKLDRLEDLDRVRLCPIPVRLQTRLVNDLALEKIASLGCQAAHGTFLDGQFNGFYWLAESAVLSDSTECFCLPPIPLRNAARLRVRGIDLPFELGYEATRVSVFSFLDGPFQAADFREYGETRDQQRQREHSSGPEPAELDYNLSDDELLLQCEHILRPAPESLIHSLLRGAYNNWAWGSLFPKIPDQYEAIYVAARVLAKAGALQQPLLRQKGKVDEIDSVLSYEEHAEALPALRVRRWLGLRSHPEGPGRFYTVKNGVLSDPVDWPSRYPGTVVLVAGEAAEKELEWARQEEERVVQQVRADVTSVTTMEHFRVPQSIRDEWRKLF